MSEQKPHVRTEFHQMMYLTVAVRMEQDQIVQVVASPFAALYDVVDVNARVPLEALATDRALPALLPP